MATAVNFSGVLLGGCLAFIFTAAGRYHRPAEGLPAAGYRTSFAIHLRHITQSPRHGAKSP